MDWCSRADGYRVRHLLEYAADHARSAGILFRHDFFCYDSAAYLAHLSIELLLKTLLLDRTERFPKTHSLARLHQELKRADSRCALTKNETAVLAVLDSFGNARYPVPNGEVEVGEDDIESIGLIYQRLFKFVPRHAWQVGRRKYVRKGRRILMKKRRDRNTQAGAG